MWVWLRGEIGTLARRPLCSKLTACHVLPPSGEYSTVDRSGSPSGSLADQVTSTRPCVGVTRDPLPGETILTLGGLELYFLESRSPLGPSRSMRATPGRSGTRYVNVRIWGEPPSSYVHCGWNG